MKLENAIQSGKCGNRVRTFDKISFEFFYFDQEFFK